jgi:hypothetical protein
LLSSLRVGKLRSLHDSGRIELRPINILVGKNSSGKSSLLRLFPLLRQSVEAETKAPILWFGRLVDFGAFRDVVSADVPGAQLSLEFELSGVSQSKIGVQPSNPLAIMLRPRSAIHTDLACEILLGRGSSDEVGYPAELSVKVYGDHIRLHISNALEVRVTLNGEDLPLPDGAAWYTSSGKLIPQLTLLSRTKDEDGEDHYSLFSDPQVAAWIAKKMHHLAHGNTSIDRLKALASDVAFGPKKSFLESVATSHYSTTRFTAKLRQLGSASAAVEELRAASLLVALPAILREIDNQLVEFAKGVRYIEPLRASAERFYRLQDLAVDEIDSSGANTAMFLNSLNFYDAAGLKEWTQTHLGFSAYADRSAGHVAIKIITEGSDSSRNIADLGFGFSQILPVILQLWFTCVRRKPFKQKSDPSSLVAMEQPELHLHPSYQAMLADVLAGVVSEVKSRGERIPLFVETHSEHIVNRLGHLVRNGELAASDVQVLLFEKEAQVSGVRSVAFCEDGSLDDSWPLGFFLPEP